MSIFSSIGNFFGGLGHDISSGISDVGHFLSNPIHDLELAGGAAAIALPFLAPEILGGLGGAGGLAGLFGGGAADAAGAGALGFAGDVGGGLGIAGDTGTALDAFATAGAGDIAAADAPLALTADATGGALTGGTAASGAVGDLGVTGYLAPDVGMSGAAGSPLSLLTGGTGTAPGGGFLSSLESSIMKNPLQAIGMGLGGAGIGMQLLNMAKGLPYESQLKANAANAGAVAQADLAQQQGFTDPLRTGNLPPQWESAVQTAAQQGRDAIASKYASMGLSNSSSEAGDIAALDARLPEIRMQIAQGMAQVGMSYGTQALAAMGLQDNIYTALMDANIKQDQALAQSIAAFAGAAGRSQAVQPVKIV